MDALDRVLKRAVESGAAAGVVAARGDARASASSALMVTTQIDRSDVMTTDTIFRIFSMTKAITGIAAAKLVETRRARPRRARRQHPARNSGHCRCWKVSTATRRSYERPGAQQPSANSRRTRPASSTSSGMRTLQSIWPSRAGPASSPAPNSASAIPSSFDPGTRWDYGVGIDWLGLVIEQVSGKRLDRFFARRDFHAARHDGHGLRLSTGKAAPPDERARAPERRFAACPSAWIRRRTPRCTAAATACIRRRPTTCGSCACCLNDGHARRRADPEARDGQLRPGKSHRRISRSSIWFRATPPSPATPNSSPA